VNFLFRMVTLPSPKRWGFALALALLPGCGNNDVQVYRAPKEQPAPQAQSAGLPPGHPDTGATPPSLNWTLPAGWEQIPAGEMRLASFRVKGDGGQADVGIVPLPGLAGGDLENVNRWRSQVGQPAIKQEELAKLAEPVEIAGQPGQLFDQAGQNPASGDKTRILAGILRRDGIAWFFKMLGDDAVVAQQKPAFVAFLKSMTFSAPSAQAELPPSHPPIGDTTTPVAQGAAAAGSSEAKPVWQVPAGWQEVPGGGFLVAKFTASGAENTKADINVSMSAGEGGGVAGNLNRWRGQLGLSPLAESEVNKQVTSVDIAGGKAMLVDMTGTDARSGQKARLVGAIVPQTGRTWFYKLMGNEQVVVREKEAFTKFVQTTKYNNQ
jgi:hypothetical protein